LSHLISAFNILLHTIYTHLYKLEVSLFFINGHLDKDIYMMQPKGFIANNQEDMMCKLQRSIYGLKQTSRSWNI